MSFTQTHHLFAAIDETGLNEIVKSFCKARPLWLHYATPPFIGATDTPESVLPSPLDITWSLDIATPVFDLAPADPTDLFLPPGANEFSLQTTVTLGVGCGTDRSASRVEAPLTVGALGTFVDNNGVSSGTIALSITQVKTSLADANLEAVIACIATHIVAALLKQAIFSYSTFTLGFVTLVLQSGPNIQTKQVQLFGTVA